MIKILYVCVQNSARSQIAEALTNQLCGPDLRAYSAGIEPGELSPLAVEVMREGGVDISLSETKGVFDMYRAGMLFNYVVTVCDETSAERCPIFPGVTKRLHWSIPDPAALEGSVEQKLIKARAIRDLLQTHIAELCAQISGSIA
ncbi:MAG TPA: arsenate reductase ArsC [Candidatus Eremiobacteraceae bacterium]|nr:arsenate reductase ArsC [Candidatus Eremiobacteraceae bacterium]